MALPTITKMQKTAQEMLNKNKEQLAASTVATQSGSTSTPNTTETPKVISTPKPYPSTTQPVVTPQTVSTPTQPVDLTKINLFKPQEAVKTIQQVASNLLSKKTEAQYIQNTTIPTNTVRTALQMWWSVLKAVTNTLYEQWTDYAKQVLWRVKTDAIIAKEWLTLLNKMYQDTWKEMYRDITSEFRQNWEGWKWVWMIRDAVANTIEWLPRWLTRAEYWLADLLDWAVDAQWATDFKNSIEKDLEYWENTRVQQRAKEVSSFKDFMKNPIMYAWWTLTEMLPMFISAWVAIPTTFAQVYWETYRDYSTDQSLVDAWLTDNQVRLMSLWVWAVNTLIELWSDLVEWIMPWTKVWVKWVEKTVRTRLSKPFMNIFKNVVKWWLSEWVEEVTQNEIQEQVASRFGSDRELPTRAERLTTFGISAFIGWILQWWNIMIEIEWHKELEKSFEEWSEAVDDFAPWVPEEDKKKFFSAIVAAEIQDQQMSDRQINKYQQESEQLYNQKAQLEEQLKTTTDENVKQSITNQINNIDTRITQINERLKQWQNVMENVNKQLEEISRKSELPAQQSAPQQQWWENLSQQTMSMTTVQKEINKIEKKQDKRKSVDILSSDFVDNELPNMLDKYGKLVDNKSAQWIADNLDDSSLLYLKRYLEFEKNNIPVSDRTKYNNLLENVKKAEQISKQVKEELKSLRKWDISSSQSFNDFLDKVTKAWENWHLDDFILTELNNWLHILWLKWVNIKSTEWKITEETAKRFSRMIARMSQTFWIDFNKVINWIIFELTETEWKDMWQVDEDYEWFGGFLTQVYPKEVLEKLKDETWYDLDNRPLLKAEYWLLRAWIALAIDWKEQYAAPLLAHEFIHLLELRKALDDWLELHIEWFDNIWHVAWQAVLEWENSWKTFKINEWTSQYTIDYLSAPSEILARYWQQYYAYKNDMEEFNRLTNENWFWSKDNFDKLIDKFESVMEDEFWAYALDSWNKNYADIMERLDNNKLYEDERWLRNFKESWEEMTDRIENKMIEMQNEYLDLKRKIEWLEWDIAEEIKNGYRMTISMLESNIAMLAKMWPDYIDITTNTASQQTQMDEGVNHISDNWPELISEVEDNQQEWDIIDAVMKEEIEENKEPDTTWPLDVAVAKTVDKVITTAYWFINKSVKEKSVDKQIATDKKKRDIREVWQWIKDIFTPALSRLYGISPRLAWAVHVYQASIWLKTLWYKKLSENFVKELDKIKKKNPEAYKKLSLALFDLWMDESIDIKQSLKDAWIDETLFEPVVSVMNQIAKEYQSAWLDITINDKYFPRKVKDYWRLLEYLSRKSGTNIEDTRWTMIKQIDDINNDPNLSDWEKERQVHNLLINNFTKPSERSNNAEERKLVLSEWQLTEEEKAQWYKNDILDYYEDPIVSLSNYIDDMVKKTELKKMLWWLTNKKTAISEEFDDSIAKIILDMEAKWELTNEQAEEAKKVIKAIVNARATGKLAQKVKNLTYSMTIANRLSAAQQLEDLSKALLRWPSWFKNIVKSVLDKTDIKYSDTWLDNIFAELEWWKNITDLLFKLSWFDAVDSLGKKSFLNTAFDSCVRQANSDKRSIILKTRLTQMYWEEMWNSIFESYKNNQLRDEDLDVMVDLLYQLGNTQPIYKSAMPTAYLNNPKIRVVYCLWSFTLKQVDRVIQWTKEVYNNQRLLWRSKEIASMAATVRCVYALFVVSIISALVQELINLAKWDEDDLMFKKWKEEWFGAFLKQFWINSLSWLLKIFNISKYDQYIFNREWLDAVLINKITPAWLNIPWDIIQVLMWKDKVSEMWKYMPLFLKPLYYQFKNRDMLPDFKLWWWETTNKKSKTTSDKFWKTSVWTKWPSNSSKFWWYSVQ